MSRRIPLAGIDAVFPNSIPPARTAGARILPALALLVALLVGAPATPLQGQDGFLFGPATGQLTLRAGPMLHRTDGDLFDYFRTELTLERGDFRAPSVQGEITFFVHPRVGLSGGLGWSSVDRRSEFREWVDLDDLPIEQTTTLMVVPITASGRLYLSERGQSISDLAWIPARTTPYVGAGGGVAWYRLRQAGDFVASNLAVYPDDFVSESTTFTAHGLAGIEHWLGPRLGLSLEGRYTVSADRPVGDFVNWDRIDLGGFQIGVGLSYRW